MRKPLLSLALCLIVPASLAAAQTPKPTTAHLKTADGKDAGTATFQQTKTGVKITLNFKNLPPGDHGVHIHQNAVCEAPAFTTAGGHFNPDMKKHGTMNPDGHHNGDLPQNVTVAANGTGKASFTVASLSMAPGAANSIFANGGTSIMVHAAADDMKTDPTGNAGARIACGVIKP